MAAGIFRAATEALNLGMASRLVRMGLKEGQLGGVLGAYFRGVDLPKIGAGSLVPPELMAKALPNAPGHMGRAIFRGATAGLAGMAAYRMMPRNDIVAAAGAGAAFYGGYRHLGKHGARFASRIMGRGLGETGMQVAQGVTGLMAGSMVWSGLRTQRPADFLMRG